MVLRLARQTFVRYYGEFSYLFGKVTAFDQVFRHAEPFLRPLTREAKDWEAVVDEVWHAFEGVARAEVAADFEAFIRPLIEAGVILCGETPEALEALEPRFTYAVDDPKTLANEKVYTQAESEALPATLLERYFAEHPTLFELQLDITQACTERCRHCYVPEYNPLFLPYEKICEVLDDFRAMGGLHISLSGGECMLHPDFIRIVRAIRELDCTVACLSNLTVMSDEILAALVEADATVQVSLYSMEPEIHDEVTRRKGSWRETMGAIVRLREADIPVRISCPCLRINYKGYPAVLAFAKSLKMSAQTDFIIMGKSDCDTSNLCNRLTLPETSELLEDVILRSVPMNSEYFNPAKKEHLLDDATWARQKACGACVNSLCLNASGEYYPCPGFAGFPLGSCYQMRLKEVWLKSPVTQRIRAVTNGDFKRCVGCPDRDYCSQCMCRNYNETGELFTPAEHFCKVAALNHEIVDQKQAAYLQQ